MEVKKNFHKTKKLMKMYLYLNKKEKATTQIHKLENREDNSHSAFDTLVPVPEPCPPLTEGWAV